MQGDGNVEGELSWVALEEAFGFEADVVLGVTEPRDRAELLENQVHGIPDLVMGQGLLAGLAREEVVAIDVGLLPTPAAGGVLGGPQR